MRQRARAWDVSIELIDDRDINAEPETLKHKISAPTAQQALAQLVLTSTQNARVRCIHVELDGSDTT